MDELAAAAAVVAIVTDANAPEDFGQRDICVTAGVAMMQWRHAETSAEDKENIKVHAAAGEPEDAPSEVPNAPPILLRTRSTQPLTR